MLKRISISLCSMCAIAVCFANAPARAEAPTAALITHVPLNEMVVGPLQLTFDVQNPQLAGQIVVHVRSRVPGTQPSALTALRSERGYAVDLPESHAAPPGFDYYVVERMPDGSERPVFATQQTPHYVRVTRPPEVEAERQRLAARGGQRSSVILAAEAVDYGDHRLNGVPTNFHDRYYRLEAGYAFAFLSSVESIRLSLVRVRGETTLLTQNAAVATPTAALPGIDYGRAEITLHVNDWLRTRSSLLLGASQDGFEYGGGGAVTIGDPRDVAVDLGIEGITTLGTTGWLRLGFHAHPRVPMGATVEISSFPLGEDTGVRLLYDVGYRFGAVTQLLVRAGYQGRTSVRGGPSVGAAFEYGF